MNVTDGLVDAAMQEASNLHPPHHRRRPQGAGGLRMNMSVLQANVMSSLSHEEAKFTFLRAQEQPWDDRNSYAAEALAREVDDLCDFLKPAIGFAARPYQANNDMQSDLLAFILKRHWHMRTSKALEASE